MVKILWSSFFFFFFSLVVFALPKKNVHSSDVSIRVALKLPTQSKILPKKDLILAIYQELGAKQKLSLVLSEAKEAIENWTGFQFVSQANVERQLGQFGLDTLGKCFGKTPCLLEKSASIPSTKALYLFVGQLGEKLIVKFQLFDLEKKVLLQSFQQRFATLQALKEKMPEVAQKLFPNFAKVRVKGAPNGAHLLIANQNKGTLPDANFPVPAGEKVVMEVQHPGYFTKKIVLQLKAKEEKEINVVLELIPVKQEPMMANKGGAVYKKWWFWTAIVGGGAAVATGVVLGITLAPKASKTILVPF